MPISYYPTIKRLQVVNTIYGKISGGHFLGFHYFLLNRKSFPATHGLVDQQYKCKNATAKVLARIAISNQNMKVFSTEIMPCTVKGTSGLGKENGGMGIGFSLLVESQRISHRALDHTTG